MELDQLMAFEKELRSNQVQKDDFWNTKMQEERKRLEGERHSLENELQKVINQSKMEEFDMSQPTVMMMTQDLQEKI